MPLVSILIPCRNAAGTLSETLDSALAQDGMDKEIIVVDDGSTDGSREVAKSYEVRGVRVIEGPRINASAARNRALEASRGDYIQYLDADDLLGPDKVRRQIEVLKGSSEQVATARWGRFRESIADVVFANDEQLHDWSPLEWLVCHCSKHQMMHPAAWLVPRGIAEQAGPWDERLTLNDDGEYFARVVGSSKGLKCAARAETFYRTLSGGSLSQSRGRRAFQSLWRSINGTIDVMLKVEASRVTRQAAADMCQRFFYEVYPSVPDLRVEARRKVKEFGGSTVGPDFGPNSQKLARLVGWRAALIAARCMRKGTVV